MKKKDQTDLERALALTKEAFRKTALASCILERMVADPDAAIGVRTALRSACSGVNSSDNRLRRVAVEIDEEILP